MHVLVLPGIGGVLFFDFSDGDCRKFSVNQPILDSKSIMKSLVLSKDNPNTCFGYDIEQSING